MVDSLGGDGARELKGVGHHLVARAESAPNLLHAIRIRSAGLNLGAAEGTIPLPNEDPILVVQAQNGRGGQEEP